MKKAGLIALSAISGVMFVYAVLTGILVKRIKPVPIVATPDNVRSRSRKNTRRPLPA